MKGPAWLPEADGEIERTRSGCPRNAIDERPAMALAEGTQLGPYQIVSLLGAGGMGEVYRAHDPRLGRDVPIKILPEPFSAETDLVWPFGRVNMEATGIS